MLALFNTICFATPTVLAEMSKFGGAFWNGYILILLALNNVSGTTAARYFKCVSFKPAKLLEVLSIDEFEGNSGREKYNSIIVDAEKHKVVDILPNRFENDLIKYFS